MIEEMGEFRRRYRRETECESEALRQISSSSAKRGKSRCFIASHDAEQKYNAVSERYVEEKLKEIHPHRKSAACRRPLGGTSGNGAKSIGTATVEPKHLSGKTKGWEEVSALCLPHSYDGRLLGIPSDLATPGSDRAFTTWVGRQLLSLEFKRGTSVERRWAL